MMYLFLSSLILIIHQIIPESWYWLSKEQIFILSMTTLFMAIMSVIYVGLTQDNVIKRY